MPGHIFIISTGRLGFLRDGLFLRDRKLVFVDALFANFAAILAQRKVKITHKLQISNPALIKIGKI